MKKTDKGKEFLCPKCGKHLIPYIGFSAGLIYECKNCSYRGPISLKRSEVRHASRRTEQI